MTAALSGTGNISITPYVNNLNNSWKPLSQRTLSSLSNNDTEWNMNISGNRVAFQVSVIPNSSNIGYFNLSKLGVFMMNNPTGGVRGI